MQPFAAGEKKHSFERIHPLTSARTIVAVPGAALGDIAWASLTTSLVEGCILSAAVVAPNEVRVTLANLGTKPVAHTNTTITAVVFHRQTQ